MPYIRGYSRRTMSHNISRFMREGYPQRQAVAMAYSIARKARARHTEDAELGASLSEDFWISPSDAREALQVVQSSALSFDLDMKKAFSQGKVTQNEFSQWQKWKREFDEYYASVTDSFLGWRLINSTGVLAEAERMVADLDAWRTRYHTFTKEDPTIPGPVRTFVGPTEGPWSLFAKAAVAIGIGSMAYHFIKRYWK